MTRGGPVDPAARTEWARLRRRAAAVHHPDRGGDVDAYLSAMAAIDRAFAVPGQAASPTDASTPAASQEVGAVDVVVIRTWRGTRMRLARRTRHAASRVRGRLPRSFPGARRTTDI
ncbi:hypothetical protein GCM10009740_20430 [Terrabacter terrae]|uniref:J domain-containing protein n=1 Tax=Terrabacter terrae TaxID=318434 RepID=A0ABP5FS94_9MICO